MDSVYLEKHTPAIKLHNTDHFGILFLLMEIKYLLPFPQCQLFLY